MLFPGEKAPNLAGSLLATQVGWLRMRGDEDSISGRLQSVKPKVILLNVGGLGYGE